MARYNVKVKPRSSVNDVRALEDGTLVVRVTAPPVEGEANESLIEVLADYFQKPRRCIRILSGARGRNKIVEVD